ALSIVDASDNGDESERNGYGQISKGRAEALEESECGKGKTEVKFAFGRFVSTADETRGREEIIQSGAENHSGENSGEIFWQRNFGDERVENKTERKQADERDGEGFNKREEADKSEADSSERAEQSSLGYDALNPWTGKRESEFHRSQNDHGRHAKVPCGQGG